MSCCCTGLRISLCVVMVLFALVSSTEWSVLECPTEIQEFERRNCLGVGNLCSDVNIECIYCETELPGMPLCFNNTRPGFHSDRDECITDIPKDQRQPCQLGSDYFNNAMCVAVGCQWCLDKDGPSCFHNTTQGIQFPDIEVKEHRNIWSTYIATLRRPALGIEQPVTQLESWRIDMTFTNPIKNIKIGGEEVQSMDQSENRSFSFRPLTIDHSDPYVEGSYLLTAQLDKEAPNYTPVAKQRVLFESLPTIVYSSLSSGLKAFLSKLCLSSFDFEAEIISTNAGKDAVKYHYTLEQSDVKNFTLLIPKDYTAILSTKYTEVSRVYLTKYFQLVTMEINGYAIPQSGSFTMLMLFDSDRLKRALEPEYAWMQVTGEPSGTCTIDSNTGIPRE